MRLMTNGAQKRFFRFLSGAIIVALVGIVSSAQAEIIPREGVSIALFPVRNDTEIVVWPNKYYPQDVLPEKIGRFLSELLKQSPLADVSTLDEEDRALWLSGARRGEDFAVEVELYRFLPKRTGTPIPVGTTTKGSVALRMTVYDGTSGSVRNRSVIEAKEARLTFDPDYDPSKSPYWESFSRSVYWATIQQACRQAVDDLVRGYTGFRILGRLIAPTATSTKERREYILSLGKYDSLKVGDVLSVMRSDTYITVDPENPVVLLPQLIGEVTVTFIKEREAIVVVTKEDSKNPIRLRDLVSVPIYKPRKGEGF